MRIKISFDYNICDDAYFGESAIAFNLYSLVLKSGDKCYCVGPKKSRAETFKYSIKNGAGSATATFSTGNECDVVIEGTEGYKGKFREASINDFFYLTDLEVEDISYGTRIVNVGSIYATWENIKIELEYKGMIKKLAYNKKTTKL